MFSIGLQLVIKNAKQKGLLNVPFPLLTRRPPFFLAPAGVVSTYFADLAPYTPHYPTRYRRCPLYVFLTGGYAPENSRISCVTVPRMPFTPPFTQHISRISNSDVPPLTSSWDTSIMNWPRYSPVLVGRSQNAQIPERCIVSSGSQTSQHSSLTSNINWWKYSMFGSTLTITYTWYMYHPNRVLL